MAEDPVKFLKERKAEIDRILESYLPRELGNEELEAIFGKPRHAYDMDALTNALSVPIWDFLDRGGKRIRPALFLIVAEALGGDVEKMKDFAAVVEFAHEGSIMIDDIEDLGELRRGKPCTHKIFGEDVAINAGNLMYFIPMLVLMRKRKDFDDKTMLKAWEIFAQEMVNIHAGQAMDIYWHRGKKDDIEEREYLQMCSYKTGCLTRMAAKLAAVLSGANEDITESLGRFAEIVGIGFQIQDDILSASGSEFQETKGYGDDITEGKRTLIVIHALKNAGEKERARLLEILNMHTRDRALISEAIGILKETGSIIYARERASQLIMEAWEEVDGKLPESGAKNKLKGLAHFLIKRKT